MMKDPRFRNVPISGNSIGEFVAGYHQRISAALASVDQAAMEAVLSALRKCASNGAFIYVAGNGGSAAIGDHLCCDWMKGTHSHGHAPLRVVSLNANTALFTAIANDFGYDQSVSKQIEMLARPGDALVLISSSGNSPNIISALEKAKALGMTVIGFSGFTGGKLKEMADISLYVADHNYGVVEDCHQILMHSLAQYLVRERDHG